MGSKEYFNEIATQWDEMRSRFFSENVREKALALAGVQKGQTAADIGAGSGFITAGLVREGLRVIVVDQSEAMLAEMKRKFASAAIDYRLSEGERLPLADAEVDYAFANMYLHHVERPPQAIAEMARIVKPGGRVVVTDADEHNYEFLRTEQHDRWLGFKREDIRRWFAEAGLSNVRVESLGETCCVSSDCGSRSASINIFVAYGEK